MLDEDQGEYWNLNPTGALVLQTLLAGGTPDEAAHALVDEYGIAAEDAARDVRDLLEALRAAGLVNE